MIVVIAEKPSVASDIAAVLGATVKRKGFYEGLGYQVTWAYGHLVSLQESKFYNPNPWNLASIPIIPE